MIKFLEGATPEDDEALDDVLELSHIAGPTMFAEAPQHVGRKSGVLLSVAASTEPTVRRSDDSPLLRRVARRLRESPSSVVSAVDVLLRGR